jgi:hypothetical protein
MVRSTSSWRPISGSILPSTASSLRLVRTSRARCRPPRSRSPSAGLLFAARTSPRRLGHAVGDVVDDVEARDVLLVEQVHRMALLLAEDRDQHVGDADFLLAARLHVEHGPLQHALEAQRRLHLAVLAGLELRRGSVDVVDELVGAAADVAAAGASGSRARAASRGSTAAGARPSGIHGAASRASGRPRSGRLRVRSTARHSSPGSGQVSLRPARECTSADAGGRARRW